MDENENVSVEETAEQPAGELIKANKLYAMVPLNDYIGLVFTAGIGIATIGRGVYKVAKEIIIPEIKDGIERHRLKKQKLEAIRGKDADGKSDEEDS